jgi:type I restriction enzyme R subunit
MSYESERTTRRGRIDPKLQGAGWNVVPAASPATTTGDPIAVEEFETPIGPADYALFDGGRCLGVAEAKKLTLGPQGVLVQAERYSKAIEQTPKYQGEFGAPFLYATNGEVVWFH